MSCSIDFWHNDKNANSNHQKWFYFFFKVITSTQTTCRRTFSTPIEKPPKHGFWTLQQHLLVMKFVDHAFLCWYAGIKRWVPSQDCTADGPSIRRFCILSMVIHFKSCKKLQHENVYELIPFFAKLLFSSHCKQHKWRSYVKTFWVPFK